MGARPAVAVIDSLAAKAASRIFCAHEPPSLPGAARALFVHHLAQNGEVPAHHIIAALSVGRNDAVLYDFDEVFNDYFNEPLETGLLATSRGPHT